MTMTRKEFLASAAGAVGAAVMPAAAGSAAEAAAKPKSRLKLGVSTYSYNGDLMRGCMTLEDVMADMHDLGAEGIELISEGLIPDYPNPPESWVKQWFDLLDRYELKPNAFDCFVDVRVYLDRRLTVDELVDQVMRDLKLAYRLGFKVYRGMGNSWGTMFGPPGSIWDTSDINQFTVEEKCLAYAEKVDIKLCGEIHQPAKLKSPWIDQVLEFIEKHKTKHFGFVPDFGIFQTRSRTGAKSEAAPKTAKQDPVQEQIMQRAAGMGRSATGQLQSGPEDPKDLIPLLPYIYSTHAKFWDMTENLEEASIPYENIIPVLAQNGYDGYINSEYEGSREIGMAAMQLRRQHCMIRKLWAGA